MNYVSRPTLDRATGEMKTIPMGDWITVTELGEAYGVGPKMVRTILHHIGILQTEGGGRYRLTPQAVDDGLGMRHERSKRVRWPFDVISPKGRELIDQMWAKAHKEVEDERAGTPEVSAATAALEAFQSCRTEKLTTQGQVLWLADHFPDLTERQMAVVVGVAQPLVHRYLRIRTKQLDFMRRWKEKDLKAGQAKDASMIHELNSVCPMPMASIS